MLKNYLEYLTLKCKEFAKKHNIFDIVLYGSVIKGKEEARDIDLLLIFKEKALKERAGIAQNLKELLNKKVEKSDIKTMNLHELFEKEFLARQAVFVEGYSLLYNAPLSKRLGFEGYALFTYNLKNLNHNGKTKFTYALLGRRKQGMIKQLNIKHLGKGVMIVPVKNSLVFEEFLQQWEIDYNKKSILVSLL